MPPAYKEEKVQEPRTALSAAEAGSWKTAEPSEDVARGDWWMVFKDPALNDLEA